MSQMPTLFDDEDYYVPPPQKETKKSTSKKDKEEKAAPETEPAASSSDTAIPDTLPDAVEETSPETIAATKEETPSTEIDKQQEIEAAAPEQSIPEPESTATETPEVFIEADTATETIPEEPELETPAEEPENAAIEATEPDIEIDAEAAESIPEEQAQPELEIPAEEQDSIEAEVADTVIEIDADEPVSEVATETPEHTEAIEKAAAVNTIATPETEEEAITDEPETHTAIPVNIAFEIPEEASEDITEQEISVAPIKEDPVNDLDKLMFSEMIAMDYTAYAGLSFESVSGPDELPKTEAKQDEELSEEEEPASTIEDHFETDEADLTEEDATTGNEPIAPLPEFNLEDKYYTIGEVAAMFGVNVSHIRFWTTEFNLKVRTTRKGDRLFNPENIARLRLIHHLVKEQKHTIKGAKEKLKTSKQAINAQVDLKDKLSFLKEKLERIKRNL